MKTTINVARRDGFMFHEGKLKSYEFISAEVDFDTEIVSYECKLGGETVRFSTDEEPKIYKSISDYKEGFEMELDVCSWATAVSRCFGANARGADDSCKCLIWTIKDNELVEVDAPTNGFVLTGEWRIEYKGKEKFYKSFKLAQKYCDLIKVDSDGVETVEKSVASRIALNDEQKEALEQVKLALANASKLGVEILFERDAAKLIAFSKSEIDHIEYDCSSIEREENDIADVIEYTDIAIDWIDICDTTMVVTWK